MARCAETVLPVPAAANGMWLSQSMSLPLSLSLSPYTVTVQPPSRYGHGTAAAQPLHSLHLVGRAIVRPLLVLEPGRRRREAHEAAADGLRDHGAERLIEACQSLVIDTCFSNGHLAMFSCNQSFLMIRLDGHDLGRPVHRLCMMTGMATGTLTVQRNTVTTVTTVNTWLPIL